jgi:hypothetical protein
MKMQIKGISEMLSNIKNAQQKVANKVEAALYQEAQIEMTESKQRVPVDTGTLRASGHVEEPVRSGERVSVSLVYGGAAEEYAIIVHEDMSAFHKEGQAKYLESVLNESAPHMLERLGKRLNLNEK